MMIEGIYNRQLISKVSPYRFVISQFDSGNQNDCGLVVDFGAFMPFVNYSHPFLLMHWQAKPKFSRRWGILCKEPSEQIIYRSFLQVEFAGKEFSTIQLEDSLPTVPSAVLYFPDAHILDEGDKALVLQ